MNPPNNIQNGFFTPVSPFFSKIRKLTVFSRNPHTPIILQSVRLRMGADGSFVPKTRLLCLFPAARPVRPAHSNSSETKKIICPTHAAHVGHMIGDLMGAYSFHRLRAVPLPRGGRSGDFAGQGLRPCRRLHIGALRSPLSPFARPLEDSYTTPGAGSQPCSFQRGLWGS